MPPAFKRIEEVSVPIFSVAIMEISSPAFKTVSFTACVTEPEDSRLISVPASNTAINVISPLFAIKSIFYTAVRLLSIFKAVAESIRIYPPAVNSS